MVALIGKIAINWLLILKYVKEGMFSSSGNH